MKGDDKVPRPPLHVASVRMVNYYPETAGWTNLWTRFPTTTIERDMKPRHWLGANTVRCSCSRRCSASTSRAHGCSTGSRSSCRSPTATTCRSAVSLFDGWHAYGDVKGSENWARAILQ